MLQITQNSVFYINFRLFFSVTSCINLINNGEFNNNQIFIKK